MQRRGNAGPPTARVVSVTMLEGAGPFSVHHRRYDEWFARHEAAYLSELLAVRTLLPWQGKGLEIGVGTGRFAAPLGVAFGVDPAAPALAYARERATNGVRLDRLERSVSQLNIG